MSLRFTSALVNLDLSSSLSVCFPPGVYNSDYSETSVEWRDNVDQSFSQGGLKLENNKIVIPRSGLYFVYSQASFRVSCQADPKHQVSHRMVHLSHTVQRWSKTYGIGSGNSDEYQTLLDSVRTVCEKMPSSDPEGKGPWFSVVSMGAVFHLEEGDKLKTLTPHRLMSDLEDDSGKTFFGVFAL